MSFFYMPKPLGTAKLPKIDDYGRNDLNQTLLCRSKIINVLYEFRTYGLSLFDMPKPLGTAKLPKIYTCCRVQF